ncbi:hypothetical protein Pcinc_009587 [Petrolisthes cinctipes]|nr:hypothetical protein Pcinc_009587 [Petrolisthes cinctipes]
MEKQKEDVKNKFVELLQGVQGLTQTNSDMHGTRHYMNSILNQIKKADNIGCIRSLDNCVEQFLADFTKNKKVGKEERTSTAAGVGGNMSNGQWVGMGRKQPLPKPNLPVQKCQVAFEDGRLVMHCLGSPIIDGLSLKVSTDMFTVLLSNKTNFLTTSS